MSSIPTATYFDRRVPETLMAVLRRGGFAHSLVEYARSGQYGLDLGLRAGPKSPETWTTLYVGTTKALDLFHRPDKGFRLKAHSTWKADSVWRSGWERWQSDARLSQEWPSVERFIEQCIERVAQATKRSYLKEGIVQAGVSRFGAGNPFIVDREAVVGYRDQPTKSRLLAAQRKPLAQALALAAQPLGIKWLQSSLTASECDLLAITREGELLTVEIKPAAVGNAIATAPLQAWQYAQQFQAWARETEATGGDPGEILQGMYAQRRELGLSVGPAAPRLGSPLVVRPTIAVRPGHSATIRQRLARVVRVMRDAELDSPPMRCFTVNLVGRLDQFDPLDPDSWD